MNETPPVKPRPAKKPVANKKVNLALPIILQKIPLPYLAGGVAAVIMVLVVVVKVAITPVPMPPPPVAAEAPEVPPVEASSAPTATSSVPEYRGPQSEAQVQEIADPLALVDRVSQEVNELGRQVVMTREQFEAQTQEIMVDQINADRAYAYRVRIPKNWAAQAGGEGQVGDSLTNLAASYVSPPDLEYRSTMQIFTQRLPFITSARDFLVNYTLDNRLTIQAMSAYGPERAEAIYLFTEKDITYVARMAVLISGPRVLMGKYIIPNDKYEIEKDLQTWVISTLQLTQMDIAAGEPVRRLDLPGVGSVSYPESWQREDSNLVASDRLRVSISQYQNVPGGRTVLSGRIDVFAFARNVANTPERNLAFINERFGVEGLRLGEPTGRFIPAQNKHKLVPARSLIYPINNDANTYQGYQYWVARYAGQGWDFYVGMLTTPQSAGVEAWFRNNGAFDYVVANMVEGELPTKP